MITERNDEELPAKFFVYGVVSGALVALLTLLIMN